jgi:hypothetical protein
MTKEISVTEEFPESMPQEEQDIQRERKRFADLVPSSPTRKEAPEGGAA